MRKVFLPAFIFLAFSTISLFAAAALPKEIKQYYDDLNYIANNASPGELGTIVNYLGGKHVDDSFLNDNRHKDLIKRVKSLKSVTFNPDAGMLQTLSVESPAPYLFTASHLEIVTGGSVSFLVQVRRESTPHNHLLRPANGKREEQAAKDAPSWLGSPRSFSFVELDKWVLLENGWKILGYHFYPIE